MKLVSVTFLFLVASVVIAELSIGLGINNYEFEVSGCKKASETICTFASLRYPRTRLGTGTHSHQVRKKLTRKILAQNLAMGTGVPRFAGAAIAVAIITVHF